jgi:hypothetical protein
MRSAEAAYASGNVVNHRIKLQTPRLPIHENWHATCQIVKPISLSNGCMFDNTLTKSAFGMPNANSTQGAAFSLQENSAGSVGGTPEGEGIRQMHLPSKTEF